MAITEWALCRKEIGQEGLQVLLCDDDGAFLQSLRPELERIFSKLNMTASVWMAQGPGDLKHEWLSACDLVFLDIDFEREEQNGIDIARMLRKENRRGLIFFVTNYIDYAPEGYEVQAFRYILKRDMAAVLERYLLQAMDVLAEGQECLRLKDGEAFEDLPLEGISYLEVMDHYVSIHTGETSYTMGATLSGLERALEPHGFLRIHKSYLVNMRHIKKFRSRECLLQDGTVLAVGEKNYAKQKQKYLLWKGMK